MVDVFLYYYQPVSRVEDVLVHTSRHNATQELEDGSEQTE
jgi:hypothetical protein